MGQKRKSKAAKFIDEIMDSSQQKRKLAWIHEKETGKYGVYERERKVEDDEALKWMEEKGPGLVIAAETISKKRYEEFNAREVAINEAVIISILPKLGKNQHWPMLVYWWIFRETIPENPLYSSKGLKDIRAARRFLETFQDTLKIIRPELDFDIETENIGRYIRKIRRLKADAIPSFYQEIEQLSTVHQQAAFDAILYYKPLFFHING